MLALNVVEQITLLKLEELTPSEVNVRQHIDPERVRSLASDIAIRGLINPLVVRAEGGKYGVVCGRMRLEAIRLLQRERPEDYERLFARGVPCVVKELDDVEATELSLSENLRQNSLTPEEVGRGLARLAEFGLSEEEISMRLLVDIAMVRRALAIYRRVSAVASLVASSRPGRPARAARRSISRSGVASLLSVLEKKERRGEIKPHERERVLEVVKQVAEQKPLSTSELEILAKKIERNPDVARDPSRLRQVIEEVVKMDTVERVIALKRSLAEEIEEYAAERQETFDEAVNELLEHAIRSIKRS
jgi:ParB family chromosome partitioning protein